MSSVSLCQTNSSSRSQDLNLGFPTVFWAQAKKEDVIKGNLRKFDEFKAQLEEQFSDPIRPQQALNEIHSFTQGKMSAQAFLDKFEILKGISGLRDEELLYLSHQGLTPRIMSLIYGSNVAPPDNYANFAAKVCKIALNLDINYGYQHVSGSTGTNNKSSLPRDQ